MQVIPVIDLLNGQVVHAQQGKRDQYRPIQSPLCQSSAPQAVVDAMLHYYPFKTIYIADLNSIQQKRIEPQHYALIKALCKQYPSVDFWLDAGIHNNNDFDQWAALSVEPILGSENMLQLDDYTSIMQQAKAPKVLSLDFINGEFIGDQQILSHPGLWPETVIAMTLDQVGANKGPDWEKLTEIRSLNQGVKIVAAGGVRNVDDLRQLKEMNIDGVLVASALHQKRLRPKDIENKKRPV